MKVLVIPPEEFVPPQAPLSAIFQYHQAMAVRSRGLSVAVISVTPSVALKPMIISFIRRLLGRRTFYNPVRGLGGLGIAKLLWKTLWSRSEWKWEEMDGLQVVRVRLPCWSDMGPEAELAYYESCVRYGYRILLGRFGRPDILHVHNSWLAGTSVLALSKEEGLPYCLTEHSTFFSRGLIPERFHPLLRSVFASSACNLVVSPSLGRMLQAMGLLPRGYRVLPNVLDPLFEGAGLQAAPADGPVTFLHVAELTAKKGQANLLRAFSAAFAGDGNARLVIGGEGDLAEELRRLSEALGINDKVSFTGRLDRSAVLAWMQACHVFVLPSLVETFGVVVIEAHACGRPVVATICGGPEDIITEQNGMLVPAGDVDALAEALRSAKRRWSGYDPSVIRETALHRYGSKILAHSLTSLYQEILGTVLRS